MSKIQPVVTKVEKHHSEGKTTYHIQGESGNGIKNTRQKEERKKYVWLSGRLNIEERLDEGPRLQRKHDENEAK